MLIPGLTSVTFRSKSVREICTLCRRAGLSAVEWGGDVHVPSGDISRAEQVRSISLDHGLIIPSYGSYYRIGQPMDELRKYLDTVQVLGAKTVRIWCGSQGSRDAQPQRSRLIDALHECALEARSRSLMLALEYHTRTLTDDRESVQRLLQETSDLSDCLSLYWQPRFDWTEQERLSSLHDLQNRLSHIHAFSWLGNDGKCRLPLAAEEAMWKKAFSILHQSPFASKDRCVLLEFVQNDSVDSFLHDAAALHGWLNE